MKWVQICHIYGILFVSGCVLFFFVCGFTLRGLSQHAKATPLSALLLLGHCVLFSPCHIIELSRL